MRFRKIRIPAYGPFTDLAIDLPNKQGDFHLFHGPNEAGKSSLLRCLRSFLFGIDAQTSDGFVHDYKKLSITAELEKRDGTVATFQRRKGNKNTLLNEQGAPLPDTALGEYLGGVDRAYFESMFGMGSTELRNGASALLKGEGRLGETLFSASLGGTPVDKVIRSLEDEAGALFRGRANASIRSTRKQLDESLKQARESLMRPEIWEQAEKAISDLELEINELLKEKSGLINRRAWLERCRDALPIVGQYREVTKQLEATSDLPHLRDEFAAEIREARESWRASDERLAPLGIQLKGLKTQLDSCELSPDILAQKAEIHRLHFATGLFREQKLSLEKKRLEKDQLEVKIAGLCQELEITADLTDLEALRISQVRLLAVEQIAADLQSGEESLANLEKSERDLKTEVEALMAQRSVPANDILEVQTAVSQTKRFEEVAHGLAARIAKCQGDLKKLEGLRSRLPGCPADFKDLRALDLPLKSTIEKFRDSFDALQRSREAFEQEKLHAEEKVRELTAEIERRGRQKDLPSVRDLQDARAIRDRGWRLILREWKGVGDQEEPISDQPLEAAYPATVTVSDEIADRLRRDAEVVAQIEEKRLQLAGLTATIDRIEASLTKLEGERLGLSEQWLNACKPSGIQDLSPREMAEWRNSWEEFCRQWDLWKDTNDQIGQDRAAVDSAAATLQSVLPDWTGGLPSLLARAGSIISAYNEAVGANREVDRQIASKKDAARRLLTEIPNQRLKLEALDGDWTACAKKLGIPPGMKPQGALRLLRSRVALFVEFDRWRSLVADLKALEDSTGNHETDVTKLITTLDLESQGVENDISFLWESAARGESAEQKAGLLESQIEEKEQELELAREDVSRWRETLDALLREASLTGEADLPAFLVRFDERAGCASQLAMLRQSLAGLAREEPLEDFVRKVEVEGGGELMGALDAVNDRVTHLESQIEAQRTELHEWTNKRKTMETASDAAAVHSQQAELSMASLRHDCEKFAKLQLAISLLKARIDRFREQNQGPFMEKAGHWFSEITGGDFMGISAVFDSGDQPVIAGVRAGHADNKLLAVEGMSEGTQDQLFLALRLAGLELHPLDQEPMPLILDDLLVQFDDRRAGSALEALRSFGGRSQVILFTHHEHLVSLAETRLGKDGFHLHRLAC